jgi:hypothetical protein
MGDHSIVDAMYMTQENTKTSITHRAITLATSYEISHTLMLVVPRPSVGDGLQ